MTPLSVAPPSGRAGWQLAGACVDLDPEIFFPAGTVVQAARQAKAAKRACRSCTVTSACLETARRADEIIHLFIANKRQRASDLLVAYSVASRQCRRDASP